MVVMRTAWSPFPWRHSRLPHQMAARYAGSALPLVFAEAEWVLHLSVGRIPASNVLKCARVPHVQVTHYQETNITEDELRKRKSRAVKAWLVRTFRLCCDAQ